MITNTLRYLKHSLHKAVPDLNVVRRVEESDPNNEIEIFLNRLLTKEEYAALPKDVDWDMDDFSLLLHCDKKSTMEINIVGETEAKNPPKSATFCTLTKSGKNIEMFYRIELIPCNDNTVEEQLQYFSSFNLWQGTNERDPIKFLKTRKFHKIIHTHENERT